MAVYWKYTGDEIAGRGIKKRAENELGIHLNNKNLGGLSQYKSKRVFNDGTVISCNSHFDEHHVEVYTPVKKEKIKRYRGDIERTSELVFLLDIKDASDNLLGILVLDASFNTVTYIENDGSEIFSGFGDAITWYNAVNNNKYYGFAVQYDITDTTYLITELPRRSQVNTIDRHNYGGSREVSEGDWNPGACPWDETEMMPAGVIGPNVSYSYNLDDGYIIGEYIDPICTESMGDTTYSPLDDIDGYPSITTGAGWYAQSAYNIATVYLGEPDSGMDSLYDFVHFNCCYGREHTWVYYFDPGSNITIVEGYSELHQMNPWPPDGIQRKIETIDDPSIVGFYFQTNEGDSDDFFINDYSEHTLYNTVVTGTFSYSSNTTATLNIADDYYFTDYDSVTLINPDGCKPNDAFGLFEKWMVIMARNPLKVSQTIEYTPCRYSSKWDTEDEPDFDLSYQYSEVTELWLDNGDKIQIDNIEYTQGSYIYSHMSNDHGIYNIGDVPLYVAHFMAAIMDNGQLEYSDRDQYAMYYLNGKLHMSDKFSTSASGNGYAIVNDCENLYGGAWGWQIRVAMMNKVKVIAEEEL